LDRIERDILVRTLRETRFNRTSAAQRLGISLRQIRYRMARLQIDVPNASDEPSDA
jgi:two-component system response regulator PilR (NtrC family)